MASSSKAIAGIDPQHAFHHLSINFDEAKVAPDILIGERLVIESHELQDGGVQVVEVGFHNPVALGRFPKGFHALFCGTRFHSLMVDRKTHSKNFPLDQLDDRSNVLPK